MSHPFTVIKRAAWFDCTTPDNWPPRQSPSQHHRRLKVDPLPSCHWPLLNPASSEPNTRDPPWGNPNQVGMEHGESENGSEKTRGKLEVGEGGAAAFWLLFGNRIFPLRRGLMFIAKTPRKKGQVHFCFGILPFDSSRVKNHPSLAKRIVGYGMGYNPIYAWFYKAPNRRQLWAVDHPHHEPWNYDFLKKVSWKNGYHLHPTRIFLVVHLKLCAIFCNPNFGQMDLKELGFSVIKKK